MNIFTQNIIRVLALSASTLFCGQLVGMATEEAAKQKRQWELDLINTAKNDDLDKVRELLSLPEDQKGNIDAEDDYGWTALYNAVRYGLLSGMVKELLNAGADAKKCTNEKFYEYPLHAAARRDRPSVIQALVNHGAQLDATDWQGDTPLHFAVRFNKTGESIKLLVKLGAAKGINLWTIKNNKEVTPWDERKGWGLKI
jgi:hypothetical protein